MSDWEGETGGSTSAAFTVLPAERRTVRGDAVRVDDVLVLDGREYTVKAALDTEGRGKVTGISLWLIDNANGSRRSHNVGASAKVKVIR